MMPIRVILHPTDFSALSQPAFQIACALARDYQARLIVLHVREVPAVPYGEFGQLPMELEPAEAIRAKLDILIALRCETDIAIKRLLKIGDPATEILAAAQETDNDMIVLGTHGRTGLARLLMGSVADQVLRKASCPVLTIKAPLAKDLACKTVRVEPMHA